METLHKSKESIQEGKDQKHKEDNGQRNIIKNRSTSTQGPLKQQKYQKNEISSTAYCCKLNF